VSNRFPAFLSRFLKKRIMSESTESVLVLGFVGDQEVPGGRANADALLTELIAANRKRNKGELVRFVISVEPFTESLQEIADYCIESKYELCLVGHEKAIASKRIEFYTSRAKDVVPLGPTVYTPVGVVNLLSLQPNARLILLSQVIDDSYDELTSLAFQAAIERNIPVRDMLKGLDSVRYTDEEEPDQMARRHEDDDDDFDPDADYDDDGEGDDDGDDGIGESDDDDDDQGSDDSEEGGDDTDWDDSDEETGDDDDTSDGDDDGEDDDDEPEEPPARSSSRSSTRKPPVRTPAKKAVAKPTPPARKPSRPAAAPAATKSDAKRKPVPGSTGTKWTEQRLAAIAARDMGRFWEVAGEFGVVRGKGMKVPVVIKRVLAAQDGGVTPKAAPAAKTAAPAKKAAPQRTASKPAHVPDPKPRPQRPKETPNEPINEGVDVDTIVKNLIREIGEALIARAEQL
jgi:hypothetical protein